MLAAVMGLVITVLVAMGLQAPPPVTAEPGDLVLAATPAAAHLCDGPHQVRPSPAEPALPALPSALSFKVAARSVGVPDSDALAFTARRVSRTWPHKGANIVFRGGSKTASNLTPRLKDLEGQAPGLSTWRTAANALENNTRAQAIDLNRLKELQAIEDETGHVSITPGDPARLAEWAATRGTDVVHPYTRLSV